MTGTSASLLVVGSAGALLGHSGLRTKLGKLVAGWPAAGIAGLAIAAPAMATGAAGAWLALVAALPLALLAASRDRGEDAGAIDWLALAVLIIPLEIAGAGTWWPRAGEGPHALLLEGTRGCLILVGFGAARRLPGLGSRWEVTGSTLATAAAALAAILAVAAPVALLSGSATWAPRVPPGGGLLLAIASIILFHALPQELIFRGLIFNLLQRGPRGRHGPIPALIVSSLLFAAVMAVRRPVPEAGYFLLVFVAGATCGWCYLRSGSLMPGIIVQSAVACIHEFALRPTTGA